jgi:S-adenosylmethionine decarboxylase
MSPIEGHHLIADLAGCSGLDDAARIQRCLVDAARAAGATVLEVRLHKFGGGMGVTGVALLAESHISIHTWPEHGTACIDIFMCGTTHSLDAALTVIATALTGTVQTRTLLARRYGAVA